MLEMLLIVIQLLQCWVTANAVMDFKDKVAAILCKQCWRCKLS